jgi:DnaK suppressor protein
VRFADSPPAFSSFFLSGGGAIHILRALALSRAPIWGIVVGLLAMETRPILPSDYRPSEDEEFMNPFQREYFRQKLLRWRAELLEESSTTLQHLKDEAPAEPDVADRASKEYDRALELRTRDRERKLISKIDAALLRIEEGRYGYCEITDEPIGLRRLEARPIATLSLEAQERHERRERTYRDE